MREVDGSYAVFKDADRCDRDLKRCELAAKYVRQRTEAKIRAIADKGADAAVSFVLRQSEVDQTEKKEAVIQAENAESEKKSLEERLSKLNATLKGAISKFVENRKSVLSELEMEKKAKDAAISERDAAISKMDEAVAETRTAKSLYAKVAKKADDADKIANLLKGYGKSGTAPVAELTEILNEVRRANSEVSALRTENGKLHSERIAYQRTTARNFELERQVSALNETLRALENQVRAEIALRLEAESEADALKS